MPKKTTKKEKETISKQRVSVSRRLMTSCHVAFLQSPFLLFPLSQSVHSNGGGGGLVVNLKHNILPGITWSLPVEGFYRQLTYIHTARNGWSWGKRQTGKVWEKRMESVKCAWENAFDTPSLPPVTLLKAGFVGKENNRATQRLWKSLTYFLFQWKYQGQTGSTLLVIVICIYDTRAYLDDYITMKTCSRPVCGTVCVSFQFTAPLIIVSIFNF